MAQTVGPPACECGLSYVAGHPGDEALHAQVHSEYRHGMTFPSLLRISPAAEVSGYALYQIDSTVPKVLRMHFADLAMVAHRSLPGSPAGYYGTVDDEYDQRLYLLADEDRAFALAVTCLNMQAWPLRWSSDGRVTLEGNHTIERRMPTVARVWVGADYRRQGLATGIVKAVASLLATPLSDLGWELPLTDGGQALVRKLAPNKWWGCGEVWSLEQTLKREP